MNLSNLTIRKLPAPETGQRDYFDDALTGLAVRVSKGGTKTFVLLHGTPRRRTTLGRFGIITLAQAREAARHILAAETLVRHRPERFKATQALDTYLTFYSTQKSGSVRTLTSRLNRHVRPTLEGRFLEDISPADVSRIFERLIKAGQLGAANAAFQAARAFFNWCVERHYLTRSPCKGKLPAKRHDRDRLLSVSEFKAIWHACVGEFGDIVRLCFLTGQRINQIAQLEPSWIDGDTITFPASIMKNNRQHTIPIGPLTKQLLQGFKGFFPNRARPFQGYERFKARLDKASGVTGWVVHDTRRFHSSTHARLGTALHLEERILSHTAGVISGVAAVYNRYDFQTELREAVDRYEQHIRGLLDDPCV